MRPAEHGRVVSADMSPRALPRLGNLVEKPNFGLTPKSKQPSAPPPSHVVDAQVDELLDRPEKRRRMATVLAKRVSGREDKFAEGVVIELALEGPLIAELQQLAGRCWKLGMLEGSPVYRQKRHGALLVAQR